ncbi:MAG: hypothetical protein N4A46_14125 [Schleiferiaceae bacterium]|jgi:prolipoprotein diacylglyceryltransferase|nr:hypothetical protein [Schleiferiaceae bacterium]
MPNYFKPDWLEDWKEERKKGMLRYVLLYGIGFALACLVFDVLINKQDLSSKTIEQLFVMASIFLGGGFAYSFGTWYYNEYKLKKRTKN